MIPGFGQALADKYAILGEHADAAMTGANASMVGARAQANLANANAGQVAANAASQRALQDKQAGYYGAQGFKTAQEGNTVAPLAQSTIGLQGHQGSYYDSTGSAALMHGNAALQDSSSLTGLRGAQEGQIGAETNTINSDLAPAGGAGDFLQNRFHAGTADVLRPLTDQELHMIHQHLCMGGTVHAMGGMSQVPGQATPAAQVGTQASDKVPAMLAPDEAVLNKHGADIIGRDKIAAANAIGNHMATQERQNAPTEQAAPQRKAPAGRPAPGKGMIQPKGKAAPAPAVSHQKLAGGTHQVAHGKSAKTPTKIDPAAAMALLQMARGGGGMPTPQPGGMPAPQGNPMPMQPSP
jgi:hypothetical protein